MSVKLFFGDTVSSIIVSILESSVKIMSLSTLRGRKRIDQAHVIRECVVRRVNSHSTSFHDRFAQYIFKNKCKMTALPLSEDMRQKTCFLFSR